MVQFLLHQKAILGNLNTNSRFLMSQNKVTEEKWVSRNEGKSKKVVLDWVNEIPQKREFWTKGTAWNSIWTNESKDCKNNEVLWMVFPFLSLLPLISFVCNFLFILWTLFNVAYSKA